MGMGDVLLEGPVLGFLVLAATVGGYVVALGYRLLRLRIRRACVRRELAEMASLRQAPVLSFALRASRSIAVQGQPHLPAVRGVRTRDPRVLTAPTSSLDDDLRSSLNKTRVH
jgi:hypothetical protein